MNDDVASEIAGIKDDWGERLFILGHHYQRSSVLRHADATGDSLELARKAAQHPEAERIVFCGVRFMAESADILTGANQTVYMPVTSAGCPMADMATAEHMAEALGVLQEASAGWLPVVYVNSSAAVKACCGRHNGSACTSSNAARVFEWVRAQGKRIFFLPDEHLGVNTAFDLGIDLSRVALYDPAQPAGGLTAEAIRAAEVVVWKGFCIVHKAFSVAEVKQVRERLPDARIIVHPETPREVVELADAHGSTSQIIRYVNEAPDGATIVVGTEVNLVDRLAEQQAGRVTVKCLKHSVCANMAKTSEKALLELLRDWPADRAVHVPEDEAAPARQCLETMLSL